MIDINMINNYFKVNNPATLRYAYIHKKVTFLHVVLYAGTMDMCFLFD